MMDFSQAACRGATSVFFADGAGESYDKAREVCAECPIQAECLDYALRNFEEFGFWGGKSPKERLPLQRLYVRGPRPIKEHGTEGGYQGHRKRGEEACRQCREAHALRVREYHETHPRDRRKVKT